MQPQHDAASAPSPDTPSAHAPDPAVADTAASDDAARADGFIQRWQGVKASELATAQSFVLDLCELLGVDKPHASAEQDYMFERPLKERHADGSTSERRIDCYKRGHFVLEAKKIKLGSHTKSYDDTLLRAHAQAQNYARALPASEGRPPFLVVVDVGQVIQLFAEFSRTGGSYTPFPDPRSHQIRLSDLRHPAVRQRLRLLWTDPLALDPSRVNAQVTRQVASVLAQVAHSLESDGHAPQQVAAFLTRCLFCMFAEDVGLLPADAASTAKGPSKGAFSHLLVSHRDDPKTLQRMLQALWADMDRGGFSAALASDVRQFNGKLFKAASADGYTLPLSRPQIDQLLQAASANWTTVEPAIFGTLLERALDPIERHALGAHYTPRAYVERLIWPTVIEPLRQEWSDAQTAALLLANEAQAHNGKQRETKLAQARAQVRQFHHRLCSVRVLDPACGSGNFLYVTLEHLKRLEGEVLNQLDALGGDRQEILGLEGETVTLQQLRGIEINPRAAALAELVLWIGFLQWQARTVGVNNIAEPVVHDYGNIENRDAVLAYDDIEPLQDAQGQPLTRWDGLSHKPHPVTGLPVPDEAAQVPQWRYIRPRKANWPKADFIVGNPPFIGKLKLRAALGDGYVQALRHTWAEVPDSADFVMYWWHKAAETVRKGKAQRFGFITTNSLTMIFNRRVIEAQQNAKPALSLHFAIADHPWVDSSDGAAVRIAMSVGRAGLREGSLARVLSERTGRDGEVDVTLDTRCGLIHADLSLGANTAASQRLQANRGLSNTGVIPHGAGMLLGENDRLRLEPDAPVRPYLNGKDLTHHSRGLHVIDCHGLSEAQVLQRYPKLYQWLFTRVKPEREVNPDKDLREKWWLHRRNNDEMRRALRGLKRYIVTVMTAKHRVFQFIDGHILPDQMLVTIASDHGAWLSLLSSTVHVQWALSSGGTLEDRPRYNKTVCFETFPFPGQEAHLSLELAQRLQALGEQLDAHRKTQLTAHPELTLTALYNVLDKQRRQQALSAKEQRIHELGLVTVLGALHEQIDSAVLQAYGWSDLGPAPWADEAAFAHWSQTLLQRLVDLNAQRAAEEADGTVRWLRPDFQNPVCTTAESPQQSCIDLQAVGASGASADPLTPGWVPGTPTPWPSSLPEQVKAVADLLSAAPTALSTEAIAAHFKGPGRWRERLPTILEALVALGRAQALAHQRWKAA